MILALPDIRQRNNWSCGEAAVRTVFQFHGAAGKIPLASPIDGTDPRGLEAAFWRAGLSVQSGSMDLDDLRHHTRKGRPVVCLVTHDGVGHYVVVGGVHRGLVYFQDPLRGAVKQQAEPFEVSWKDVDRFGVRYVRWSVSVEGWISE